MWQAARSPLKFGRGVVRRVLTLVGPDTFVRQKLLPRDAAYPDMEDGARRHWDRLLKLSWPALIAVTLTVSIIHRQPPPAYTWPSLGLLVVAALFHARTRNRVAFLPVLALFAGQQISSYAWAVAESRESATLWAAAQWTLAALLIFAALIRIRCSKEF